MDRHLSSSLFFIFIIFFLLPPSSSLNALLHDHDDNDASPTPTVNNATDISTPSPSSSSSSSSSSISPPPPPPPNVNQKFSPFRPSIAVVVGVLTTMFSITLLLLLYAKHCKRGTLIAVGYVGSHSINSRGGGINAPNLSSCRKNSGIHRSVVESLPVFRFGSLLGQKDGLECAVCLTRFESTDVLRLLPKCKHAFHVECVDTWLDAHSTCPLCRYRVDPEDILLVEDAKILHHPQNQVSPPEPPAEYDDNEEEEEEGNDTISDIESGRESTNSKFRRVSGRHSSAGERGTGFLQILVQKPGESESGPTTDTASCRRSLDSWSLQKKKKNESVAIGCFDRPRKDGLLLTDEKTSSERRLEHRIIVSPPGCGGFHQRWSDVQPSDLLYLRSEKIISDSRRFSLGSSSRPSVTTRQQQRNMLVALQRNKEEGEEEKEEEVIGNGNGNGNDSGIDGNRWRNGKSVINSRSVSEITGLSRYSNRAVNSNNDTQRQHLHCHRHQQQQQQRQARLLSRWLAWISQSRPPPST